MPDIKKMGNKFRLVHRGCDMPVERYDDETGQFNAIDGGGFDNENEARAKRASEISRKGSKGPVSRGPGY